MPRTYTAAVIGAGMGGKASMRALEASDRLDLVAITDMRDSARAEVGDLYPNVQTFAHHRDMFSACPTDIVCVSTWPPSHLEATRSALDLPLKGILVEKPLADNTRDGREILDLIQARNLPMATPHGLLVANHASEILNHVHAGRIGDLKLIEIQNTRWDILNAGIHWLNFVVVLTRNAPVDYVLAACDTTTRTYRDSMQVETRAVTYIQFQNGLRVVMNTGDEITLSHKNKIILFRLIGTKGTLDFYGWESCYRLLNADFPEGECIQVDPGPKPAHQRHLERLADQIDKNEPDYTIPESSLSALELCEAAYLSHRHRCAVAFPLATFTPPEPTDWNPGRPYSGSGGGRDGRKL